jgi:hypothetical protein
LRTEHLHRPGAGIDTVAEQVESGLARTMPSIGGSELEVAVEMAVPTEMLDYRALDNLFRHLVMVLIDEQHVLISARTRAAAAGEESRPRQGWAIPPSAAAKDIR